MKDAEQAVQGDAVLPGSPGSEEQVQVSGNNLTVGARIEAPGGRIPPGTVMRSGSLHWAISSDEEFVLIMQGDGNLVLYRVIGQPPKKQGDTFTGSPTWSTLTSGESNFMYFQETDGNLVVYDKNNKPLWNSGSHGKPGVPIALEVSREGYLALYKAEPKMVWSSK